MLPLLAGCASLQAKGKTAAPALNVPPPPPRIIEPAPEPLPEPVSELPPTPSSTAPPPRPSRPRETARPPATDPKPSEPKPVEPVPEPAPVPQPPPAPTAQLQTPETADTSSAVKAVRVVIDRANGFLSGINYNPLSNVRKKAYDDAKRFIQQAEDALKQGNLAFAQGVASKAETLARELAGR
jgi:hypothetical protein